jgi:hypothetical protein
MTRERTRQAGTAAQLPQMAACPCPAKPGRRSGDFPLACTRRATAKRTRSPNNQFQARSQEATTMAMTCKRPGGES